MTDNPLELWYSSDKKFKEIIDKLNESGKSPFDQAKEAFYILADLYQLPKYPEDITDDDYIQLAKKGINKPRSVFEEVGIFRFLEPDDDPRSVVISAIYTLKNRTYVNINLCAEQHFGGQEYVPQSYVVYYTGNDADGKLNFLTDEESTWLKEGVKYASKIIRVE